jgi:hypothetical protein
VGVIQLERPGEPTEREVLAAATARDKLISYTIHTKPDYKPAAHHHLLAYWLEALERGDITRLMVFLPPQHGKSELVSKRLPAWWMARNPKARIIVASYGETLKVEFGGESRDIYGSEETREIFPDAMLNPGKKAATLWGTTQGGRLLSTTIGGGVTGHGAELFIVDDPVKSREEADSDIVRGKLENWWKAEARTRLSGDARILFTCTRWHELDLAATVLANSDEPWHVVSIPAVSEGADDPLGRPEWEFLWPERFPGWFYVNQYRELGERNWASLYQQRPAPLKGSLYKWFYTYDELPKDVHTILIPMDLAMTESATADYTAVSAWAVSNGHMDLIDMDRWQVDSPQAYRNIFYFWQKIERQFPNIAVQPLYRKGIHIDQIAAQNLKEWRVPVKAVDTPKLGRSAKIQLSNILAPYWEAGLFRVPRNKPHLYDQWEMEHITMPGGKNDDWVENSIIAGMEFKSEHYRTGMNMWPFGEPPQVKMGWAPGV